MAHEESGYSSELATAEVAKPDCATLLEKFEQPLFQFFSSLLDQRRMEVERLLFVTFQETFQSDSAVSSVGSFREALFERATRLVLQHLEERFVSESFEPETLVRQIEVEQAVLPAAEPEYEQVLTRSVRRLPFEYRLVFLLSDVNGFSLAEVSAMAKLDEDDVRLCRRRARLMVRRLFLRDLSHCELKDNRVTVISEPLPPSTTH